MVAIFYGRFLTTIIITAPTMAIAMIIAAVEATKYISVGGRFICACGVDVGPCGLTAKEVTMCDGQYDSLPPNDA